MSGSKLHITECSSSQSSEQKFTNQCTRVIQSDNQSYLIRQLKLPNRITLIVQNVRSTCSKCPVNLFKMSGQPVQNVRRCKINLVILFFKITLVISGVIRTSSHTRSLNYFFSNFFLQASLTHSAKGCSFLSASIASTKSFSKRIFFLVDVVRLSDLGELFLLSSCIWVRTHTILQLSVRTMLNQDGDIAKP
jgi:hypothetical protein